MLVASARSAGALGEATRRLADAVAAQPSLADLCFTAARRRTHLEHRVAVVGHDREQLAAGLRAYAANSPAANVVSGRVRGVRPSVVFCFAGYGGQHGAVGRELLRTSELFRGLSSSRSPR